LKKVKLCPKNISRVVPTQENVKNETGDNKRQLTQSSRVKIVKIIAQIMIPAFGILFCFLYLIFGLFFGKFAYSDK